MRKLKILILTILFGVVGFLFTHIIIYLYFLCKVPFSMEVITPRELQGHILLGLLDFIICWRSIRDDFLFVDSIERRGKSIKSIKKTFKL